MKKRLDSYRHIAKEKEIFAYLMKRYKLRTDAELASFLYISTPTISRVRNDHAGLTPKTILVIYDKTGLKIEKIREMAKRDIQVGRD